MVLGVVYLFLLFLLFPAFFIYFYYKNNSRAGADVIFDFSDINYKFFYFKDLRRKKEYISSELKKLLKIKSKDNSFDNLLVSLREDNKENLENFYSRLDDAVKNENEKLHEIDWALKINLKDGSNDKGVRYMSCQYMVIKDKKGYAKSFFIFFADITKDRVKVDQLKENNKKLEHNLSLITSTLDQCDVPIWIKNKKKDIIYQNNAYKAFDKLNNHANGQGEKARINNYLIKEYKSEHDDACYMAFDQTEIKEYETESKRYLASLSKLLEVSSNAFAIYDSERNLKFFNAPFVKMWGLDAETLSNGVTYEEILDDLKSKRIFPEDVDYKTFKENRMLFFKDLIMPYSDFLFLPDGRVIRVVIVQHAFGGLIFCFEDMTDKYYFESSYLTQSAVQQKTINSLSDGVIVFSENGKVAIHNPQIKKMWSIKKLNEYFHFKNFFDDIKPQIDKVDYEKFESGFFRCFNHQKNSQINIETKDGKIFCLKLMTLPDGATLLNTKDITEATLFERSITVRNKALEQVDKLKTDFLNNVSYELRSPLTSIKGYAEILSNQYQGDLNEKQKNFVSAITESSDNLLDIINDILDLASIEAGHIDLNKAFVKFDQIVSESLEGFEGKFKIGLTSDETSIFCDKTRLVHAIKKFLEFLIEFSDLKNEIEIGGKVNKSFADIYIKNVSFKDPDIVNIINDKLTNNTVAMTVKPSINCGLSILQTIVQLHSGTIHFGSNQNIVAIEIRLPNK